MGYEEALEHLDSLGIDAMKGLKPSLHRIEAICAALNHPERSVPAIHVTGTNGKTSTARIASGVLAAAGLSVATFTSPHLQTVRERLVLSDEPIDAVVFGDVFDHFLPYMEHVEKELGEQLSYFEVLTAMFFLWAAEGPVDAMVVEVGLGGRWDATNVIEAPVAVVTNVSLDHTGLLGKTRAEIATEKAGIIKSGARAVTAEKSPDALNVIVTEANLVGASLYQLDRDFAVIDNRTAVGGRYLGVRTSARDYAGLYLPLHGSHQCLNAAVALEAVVNLVPEGSLDDEVISEGLGRAIVPGRLESVPVEDPEGSVILDVAHNPDGMAALVNSLVEAFAFKRVVFVVGILGDKDYRGMLSELARIPCDLVVTEAKSVRSVPLDELGEAAHELGLSVRAQSDVRAAIEEAFALAGDGDLIVITGSHYVVGEARDMLLGPVS
jgi:dihydrofolate synthase / folylpolyglutamate synthase